MAKKAMIEKWSREPKYKVRKYNRCKICGRPHGYMRKFDMYRICFREQSGRGAAFLRDGGDGPVPRGALARPNGGPH